MLEQLKKILSGVAPTLATALGGPLAGSVVSALTRALFGKENVTDEEMLAKVQQLTADDIVKIKQADYEFALESKRLDNEREKIDQTPASWQAETNKIEAQNPNWFVAGWRPAIGWVCALSLACFFIPQFIIGSYLWVQTTLESGKLSPYPVSAGELLALVTTLLGAQIIRSIDKKNGTAK